MSKKVEITGNNYSIIKDIIKNSSCMAKAYDSVQERFNLTRDQAYKITQAVDNDYKYLKIVD